MQAEREIILFSAFICSKLRNLSFCINYNALTFLLSFLVKRNQGNSRRKHSCAWCLAVLSGVFFKKKKKLSLVWSILLQSVGSQSPVLKTQTSAFLTFPSPGFSLLLDYLWQLCEAEWLSGQTVQVLKIAFWIRSCLVCFCDDARKTWSCRNQPCVVPFITYLLPERIQVF